MKSHLLRPVLSFCVVAFLILACSTLSLPSGTSGNGGNSNNGSSAGSPTQAIQPNQPTQPTQASAQTPASKYFQEDFNGSLDGWSHYRC